MSKIKMICLDIDGTLLNSKHEISERTKEVIKIASNEREIPVILVSARMPKGILFLQEELEIEQPIICYSGALILDKSSNILSKNIIPAHNLERLYKLVCNEKVHMSLYKDDEWYIEKMDYWAKQESDITNITPIIASFNELIKLWKEYETGPNKILCMAESDEINLLKGKVKDYDLNIYPSKPTYLEIMPKEASKTSAISVLKEKFGIDRDEILAMGDNYNDMDMIEYAGLGIAMGNAPDKVKRCANKIALTNDEDGVAEAIREFVLADD
ncbi:Cof-type HAD-IIB family hydrolase [Clostridium pasteurianum]|uniref:HAD-superfamily hydrolase, subfamily IIB n=1 Tax=Clostridium pasteurianum BC1 TaxID=86416 RepID=R4K6P4_CLOPA|nr:Cof-type HAD-IIB family hydrolase [Clostridium pasteurianum]AGK96179.1 HAD-superfamily hydrolase, subfamily IIB [Clostridium pasteurianum BC1]